MKLNTKTDIKDAICIVVLFSSCVLLITAVANIIIDNYKNIPIKILINYFL